MNSIDQRICQLLRRVGDSAKGIRQAHRRLENIFSVLSYAFVFDFVRLNKGSDKAPS